MDAYPLMQSSPSSRAGRMFSRLTLTALCLSGAIFGQPAFAQAPPAAPAGNQALPPLRTGSGATAADVAPALPAAALTARKSDCRRSSVSIALAACAHIAPFHPRHQSTRGARAAHVCRSTPATAASVRSSPGSEPRRIQAVRSNRHTTPTSSVDNVSKPPGSSSSVKSKGNGMWVEVVTKTARSVPAAECSTHSVHQTRPAVF